MADHAGHSGSDSRFPVLTAEGILVGHNKAAVGPILLARSVLRRFQLCQPSREFTSHQTDQLLQS